MILNMEYRYERILNRMKKLITRADKVDKPKMIKRKCERMLKWLKNNCFIFCLCLLVSFTLVSCDAHFDEPDPSMKVGDILCTDGSVLSLQDFVTQHKEPVAVVYNVNPDINSEIVGYAVYLNDISDEAFADSLYVKQNTSLDIYALDGNENTYAIYKTKDVASPMAMPVFDLWTYGQAAYIPSVAQLRQLQEVHNFINPRIEALGGERLSDNPDECWYWSSTEVEGQEDLKAWLVSMNSGIIHETPKDQRHHCRPVVTIYRHNGNQSYYEDDDMDHIWSDFTLKLSVKPGLFDYKTLDEEYFGSRNGSDWPLKYWVAVYKGNSKEPFTLIPSNTTTLPMSLPPGKYSFVAWAEPVPDQNGSTYYFHTDDFSEMLQKHKYDYKGNDEGKTPFRGLFEKNVAFTTKDVAMELKPAFARYKLIATDRDSVTFNTGKIVISYYDLPGAIDALSGNVNLKWNDVSFTSYPDGDLLAFDHVLSNDKRETSISIKIEIFDENEELKARVNKITLPLINGGITTLKGNFYSMLIPEDNDDNGNSGGGGIGIDPEWEETVEIEY